MSGQEITGVRRAHQCRKPGTCQDGTISSHRVVDPVKMESSGKSFNRYAEPAEIADAVAFLAGPHSKFINGQVIRVDGGLTLFPG